MVSANEARKIAENSMLSASLDFAIREAASKGKTRATIFVPGTREEVQRAVEILTPNGFRVWHKLDLTENFIVVAW